jgi:hypothetical protein
MKSFEPLNDEIFIDSHKFMWIKILILFAKGADPPTLLICFSHPPPPLISSPPLYQTCRSAAIGRPSSNRIAWWWRYKDERRHDVCTQPSRHRHRRKWPREGGSWRGGTRNGGESERQRQRWWELKGGDEIRGGRVGEANQQGGRISPLLLIVDFSLGIFFYVVCH